MNTEIYLQIYCHGFHIHVSWVSPLASIQFNIPAIWESRRNSAFSRCRWVACRATWFPTVLQRSQVMSYPGKPEPPPKNTYSGWDLAESDREWSMILYKYWTYWHPFCNYIYYIYYRPGTQTNHCFWLNIVFSSNFKPQKSPNNRILNISQVFYESRSGLWFLGINCGIDFLKKLQFAQSCIRDDSLGFVFWLNPWPLKKIAAKTQWRVTETLYKRSISKQLTFVIASAIGSKPQVNCSNMFF